MILAGNKDNQKILDEFEFQPNPITHYGVNLIFILVGNQEIHKSMDEFEFLSDSIIDYRVICP